MWVCVHELRNKEGRVFRRGTFTFLLCVVYSHNNNWCRGPTELVQYFRCLTFNWYSLAVSLTYPNGKEGYFTSFCHNGPASWAGICLSFNSQRGPPLWACYWDYSHHLKLCLPVLLFRNVWRFADAYKKRTEILSQLNDKLKYSYSYITRKFYIYCMYTV